MSVRAPSQNQERGVIDRNAAWAAKLSCTQNKSAYALKGETCTKLIEHRPSASVKREQVPYHHELSLTLSKALNCNRPLNESRGGESVSVVVLISACVPSICYSGVKNCVLSEQQLKSLVVCYDDIAITFAFSQNGRQRTDWLGRACVWVSVNRVSSY